jgi:hypothetical protein
MSTAEIKEVLRKYRPIHGRRYAYYNRQQLVGLLSDLVGGLDSLLVRHPQLRKKGAGVDHAALAEILARAQDRPSRNISSGRVSSQGTGKTGNVQVPSRRVASTKLRPQATANGQVHSAVLRKGEGIVTEGIGRIAAFLRGPRVDYPPPVRKLLAAIGNGEIVDARVCRFPILPKVEAALNVVSLGQFAKNKKALNYDQVFHLFILLKVQAPRQRGAGSIRYIKLEKNEVLNIEETTNTGKNPGDAPNTAFGSGCQPVDLGKDQGRLTLNTLLKRTLDQMGDVDFFSYSGHHHNCQDFVSNILTANHLDTKRLLQFVQQDSDKLLTGFARSVGLRITNLAARLNILLHGKGY